MLAENLLHYITTRMVDLKMKFMVSVINLILEIDQIQTIPQIKLRYIKNYFGNYFIKLKKNFSQNCNNFVKSISDTPSP